MSYLSRFRSKWQETKSKEIRRVSELEKTLMERLHILDQKNFRRRLLFVGCLGVGAVAALFTYRNEIVGFFSRETVKTVNATLEDEDFNMKSRLFLKNAINDQELKLQLTVLLTAIAKDVVSNLASDAEVKQQLASALGDVVASPDTAREAKGTLMQVLDDEEFQSKAAIVTRHVLYKSIGFK